MRVAKLLLRDFRSYESAELDFPNGLTVVTGPNGEGKTNLVEAIAYLATLSSMRGAPNEAMVRSGAARAVIRAELVPDDREGATTLVEAEIQARGRGRAMLNRKPLTRSRDLLGHVRATVFAPDDLVLVKGPATGRRRLLDDALSGIDRRLDAMRLEVDRILRQRNALLRQVGARPDPTAHATLDVWDERLASVGVTYSTEREKLLEEMRPHVEQAVARIGPGSGAVELAYRRGWEGELAACLVSARRDDLRRGISNVGPHRDDVELSLGGLAARNHASQGEQRTLALALRLAVHAVVEDRTGMKPVLLLDDVFSELDPVRSQALVQSLPPGQAILTCADVEPPGMAPDLWLRVRDGLVSSGGQRR